MSYAIKWDAGALKFLQKLDVSVAKRILVKLDDVSLDPFRYLEHFERKNVYKLRIGVFRMLIDIDLKNKIFTIQVFDKRGRVYRR